MNGYTMAHDYIKTTDYMHLYMLTYAKYRNAKNKYTYTK